MGTSGAGAGGGSGGSGGGGGAGFITIRHGHLSAENPKEAEAWEAIQSIFSRLPQDYIAFVLGDVGVEAAYEALHKLHVLLVQVKSWEGIQERFGILSGPGCLRALADALSREDGPTPVHPRLRAPLKAALMNFFLRMVGDNPVIRDSGNAQEVLKAITPNIFLSTSAVFLSSYMAEFLRLEETGLTKRARRLLCEFSETKAKQLVSSFEAKFKGRPWHNIEQVGFAHLFRILKGEPEWRSEQLRRKVRSERAASTAA